MIRLEIESTQHDGIAVAILDGEVDSATAPKLRTRLLQLIDDRPNRLIVSLEYVPFIDSTGLSALVEADERAHRTGIDFVLAAPSFCARRILQITGLDRELAIHDTIADALTGEPPQLRPIPVPGRSRTGNSVTPATDESSMATRQTSTPTSKSTSSAP